MPLALDGVVLVVQDLGKSLGFYRELGVSIPDEFDGPHFEVTLPNGLRVMWDEESLIREIDPEWQTPVGQRIWLAFLCASPEEVDATYARLLSLGHTGHREPWDAFWGQRYAVVKDPDGNMVDLFAALPEH